MITSRTHLPKLTAALLAAGLVLTGCGGDDEETESQPAPPAVGADETPGGTGGGAVGLPEVTNATDLETETEIAAGGDTPPTELQTEDLVVGDGATAEASHTVSVRYTGVLYSDGSKFDSSWGRGDAPIDFPLSGVVPGFAQGIEGMKVGGRRLIVIPSDLGYGERGSPPVIPPDAALIFVVDLVETG